MKKKINNISAITLSMVMGISYTGCPIYAQEIEKVINTENVVSKDLINEKENISNIDETTVTIGKLTIIGNPSNYTYQNGELTITKNGEFTLSGEIGVPKGPHNYIRGVLKINDNLDNVTINFDNFKLISYLTSAVKIGENSKLKIYLKGKENTIVCQSNGSEYENIIEGIENGNSKLEIDAPNGENVLYAQIWGDRGSKCRNIDITISGGTVEKMVKYNDTNVNLTVADNKWIEELTNLEYEYGEKPSPKAIAKLGTPTYSYTEYENGENGTYTTETPSKIGKYYVKAEIKETAPNVGEGNTQTYITDLKPTIGVLEITKVNDDWVTKFNIANSKYGEELKITEGVAKSGREVKYYYSEDNKNWTEGLPPNNLVVGTYYAKAVVEESENYKELKSEAKSFTISKAENDFTEKLSIEGWEYGETANNPVAKAKFGEVTFTYSSEENGTYTSNVPTNAGTYYVKAEVLGTDNYTGITAIKQFTIERAEFPETPEEGGKIEITVPEWVEGNKEETQKPTVTIPEEKPEGEEFTVEYHYKKSDAHDDTYTTELPTEAGRYTLKIEIKSENYKKVITKDFTIYAKAHEITEESGKVDISTDKIEIDTEITEGDTGVYLYCTESTKVPEPPKISSTLRKVDEWEKVTSSKHVFTGLKPNTTYYVWKYDDKKPEGEKLENIYSIKTDTPSTPSKPEKPGIGVKVDVVDKIAGENRYDTSVSISQKVFSSKSEKVYLVSGEKFPDALSSATLTGKGDGPILLINDKNIDKILAEIDRLDAKEIVFIGGNSISDANEAKIRKFAKENSSVVKSIIGKDRYETAVKVAEETISKYGNKGKVIIADGRNYPDAVSIASYAAKEGIPVILVNGNKVPNVVKNFLNKYKINNAIIVGGDKAVGKDIEKLFKSVDRVAGDDRYETSKKIAERFFSGSKTVFVASGESFADSLSVSYYAGAKNAPILLTKANSLDNDTREYLEKNKNKDYIIIGGDKAINPELFK